MVERDTSGWRFRAACRDTDPEAFFPVASIGPVLDRLVQGAKRVCAGCPVQAACREWAVESLPYGIAGGMTEEERREVRRARPARAVRPDQPAVVPVPLRPSRRPLRPRWSVIADGQAAIASGTPREQVARELGVSRRTVDRWAAEMVRRTAAEGALSGGGR